MAEIGDKSFTTDLVQEIKKAVIAELGTNAFVNRYLATVSAVDTATSDITVYLSGSSDAFSGFRARGLQLPSVSDQVIACIDGQDRWIESVVRPTTSTPYLTFATASGVPSGSMVPYVGATAPTGWLLCDGSLVSRTTYAALFAVIGTKAGVGDGSTTFALPDMKDRFLAGNLATATQYAQNGGALTPNAAMSAPSHTHSVGTHTHPFSGDSHNHTQDSHSHTTPKAEVADAVNVISLDALIDSGTPSATLNKVTLTTLGSIAAGGSHTHSMAHDHGVNSTTNETDAVSNGTTATNQSTTATGSVTANTAYNTGTASATSIGTPKSGLVNFIIKT